MSSTDFENLPFDLPKNQSNVIKVIGVGGGGSNAINHMFRQGIKGVDFVICNTDSQALENSPVPNKIQLGVSLTEGLGAGANPEIGKDAAIESMDEIKEMLSTNTKMIFITAGMGGGTGTGAAPIIAKMAKELDVLTVGIVTIPFQFEGKTRNDQAQKGVENLRKNVDSLIVINNNKLREVYGNLGFKAGFSKADEVLATASRGIAEVITHHYTQNIDLRDAKTVLANSGTAIMGSATASGASRAQEAIVKALDSPLLNDNKISGAKNVLLLIVSGAEEITLDEIGEISDHIQNEAGHGANIIMGVGEDQDLEKAISVTVIATGFNSEQQDEIVNTESKKIIHTLEDEQSVEHVLKSSESSRNNMTSGSYTASEKKSTEPVIKHTLFDDNEATEKQNTPFEGYIPTSELLKNIKVTYDEVLANTQNFDQEYVNKVEVNDFIIVEANEVEEKSVAPQETTEEKSQMLMFDMPLQESETTDYEPEKENHTANINEIQVNEPDEVHADSDKGDKKIKRYTLDDYSEKEEELVNAKAQQQPKKETDPSLAIEKSTVPENKETSSGDEIDPMNTPISELMKKRAEDRKQKMKAFNYKFNNNNASRVEELERQPAYKRMGVDLDDNQPESNVSRTTLSIDEDDEIQLRKNNSYLHDNVD